MTALEALYQRIHACHVCPGMDPEKALRRLEAVSMDTDVFIVSQALAQGQLRRSGVNFFMPDGSLGNTGRNLEKFLNLLGRTVYPAARVALPGGATVPEARPGFIPVYNTELAQCWPGRRGTTDRPPTGLEASTCLSRGFLEAEVTLIRPRLLLLMGDKARKAFHKHVVGQPRKDRLGDHMQAIVQLRELPSISLGDRTIPFVPIQHASGANPRFSAMLKDDDLIELLRKKLVG